MHFNKIWKLFMAKITKEIHTLLDKIWLKSNCKLPNFVEE